MLGLTISGFGVSERTLQEGIKRGTFPELRWFRKLHPYLRHNKGYTLCDKGGSISPSKTKFDDPAYTGMAAGLMSWSQAFGRNSAYTGFSGELR